MESTNFDGYTSQLYHGFTVHGIVPPSCCMYFLGLRPQKYIQPSRGTNPIHCKNYDTSVVVLEEVGHASYDVTFC